MPVKQKGSLLLKVSETKKKGMCFLIFGTLSLIIMVQIFLFSAQKAEDSAALSGELAGFVEKILNSMEWLFGEGFLPWVKTYLRKIAHFVLYTLLGGFIMATLYNTKIKKTTLKITLSALIGLLYSISDEIHQLFINGRSGEVRDVIIDFAGVVTGIAITLLVCKIIQIIAKKRKKV